MTKAVRKEITKTDYDFLQGRIEKISMGQRDCLVNTQKKAVELLGKEIPASVYEAEDPYKAFAIWLGSEVNPVIDKNGYKMEISVSADGNSYFFDDAKIDAVKDVEEVEEVNAENSVEKIYVAHTYIFRNGALRHSEKEFSTPIAAYKYLHKKMMNYAGTTDATQTIELWDGKTSTEIYSNSTNGGDEKTTDVEIQTLIDKYDSEVDARIAAADSNAEIIACLDDYVVDVDAAAEVEEVNAEEVKISNDNTSFEVFKARAGFIRNVFDKVKGKFSIKLARPDEEANWRNDEDGWWTTKLTSKNIEYNDLYWLETNGKFRLLVMNSLSDRTLAEYDSEEEVKKAIIAIAAAVKRGDKIFAVPAPRKPIIDWDATLEEMRLEEIFTLQKNFKKYLKLGEMKLAETVFETLKTLYRQRRKKTA